MTVMERLYDNAWYVAHASAAAREALAADVTRTWMECESAREAATRARDVSALAPSQFAVAMSMGNSAQASYARARARAAEAARCTDIVGGHAFSVRRQSHPGGALTMEVESCTLSRRVSLNVGGRGQPWSATLHDPQDRQATSRTSTWTDDPWESLHRACEWIVDGRS